MLDERLHDVPADRHRRVERGKRVLEHSADAAAEEPTPALAVEPAEVLALELDAAVDGGSVGEQIEDRPGNRALARAGLADQSQRLAGAMSKETARVIVSCPPPVG